MMDTAANRRYTESHEWVEDLGDGRLRIGITDHAQEALGDMVYVELPELGAEYKKGDPCAVVESVKAASDVYAPVSGEVVEVNEQLAESPDLANTSPFSEGWITVIKAADMSEYNALLDAVAYAEVVAAEAH